MTKKTKDEQMPLSGTEEGEILARLSERVEKAVTVIQELRRERDALRSKLEAAEAKLREQDDASSRAATLEEDCERFKRERGEIRSRTETILGNLEKLDSAEE